ncbi:PPK2 family polyphosphate kinase [Methylocella sp.]|jgi:PPK2 family polyphosphate:nucleotide phosphotransferase|uniref:PPK2 family polyphosphate kinase n=1 Tax=Methylocella sp. TaxID=1978226 RepID=UPI003C25BBCB
MDYRKAFFVEPGKKLKLKDFDPNSTEGCDSKEAAAGGLDAYGQALAHQQKLLYAEKKHALLIVLQGSDASGKDGAIRRTFTCFNPQGVNVTSFKEPTPVELAHDFLWRIHWHVPAKGDVAIFNRSHYEDVLITRVRKIIDDKTAVDRLARIRDFETLLVESGTVILKFFLHISKEEQLARFEKRLVDPERNWKISEADYSERPFWDDYIKVYEDALSATSTKSAPWYVIPSNRKWFRDLALSQIVADALDDLHLRFPEPTVDLAEIRRKYHAALAAQDADK